MESEAGDESDASLECFSKSEGYDGLRFILVAWVGTPIAILGMLSNSILIKLFTHHKQLKSPTLYLLALAIIDLLICALYVPFFTVDALAIYYEEEALYRLWHTYAMLLYGTSRVAQFAATYVVVCATFERFVVVANVRCLLCMAQPRGRVTTFIATMLLVALLRLPAFLDYRIEWKEHCPAFRDYSFTPLLMAVDAYARFNFYVICLLHIVLPFLLLLSLNLFVVAMMRRRISRHERNTRRGGPRPFKHMPQISRLLHQESLHTSSASRRQRNELRHATRTMVMITFTYLFCNMFNVVITAMENLFKGDSWMVNEDGSSTKFYTYTADLISIMVTVNSFARIFVYFFCNPEFRHQLVGLASRGVKLLCPAHYSFFSTTTIAFDAVAGNANEGKNGDVRVIISTAECGTAKSMGHTPVSLSETGFTPTPSKNGQQVIIRSANAYHANSGLLTEVHMIKCRDESGESISEDTLYL